MPKDLNDLKRRFETERYSMYGWDHWRVIDRRANEGMASCAEVIHAQRVAEALALREMLIEHFKLPPSASLDAIYPKLVRLLNLQSYYKA